MATARTAVASVMTARRLAPRNEKELPVCPPSSPRRDLITQACPGKDIACHRRHTEALISAGSPSGRAVARLSVTLFSSFWRL